MGNLLRPNRYSEDDYRPFPGELECLDLLSHQTSALFALGHGANLVVIIKTDQPYARREFQFSRKCFTLAARVSASSPAAPTNPPFLFTMAMPSRRPIPRIKGISYPRVFWKNAERKLA